ncbi:MAG: flagellar hook-length control protein FliK [Verrucomicrobia bacterium]|nr:flagellar hook-length control protein FliK [Verrucomicrobiota bacterium]
MKTDIEEGAKGVNSGAAGVAVIAGQPQPPPAPENGAGAGSPAAEFSIVVDPNASSSSLLFQTSPESAGAIVVETASAPDASMTETIPPSADATAGATATQILADGPDGAIAQSRAGSGEGGKGARIVLSPEKVSGSIAEGGKNLPLAGNNGGAAANGRTGSEDIPLMDARLLLRPPITSESLSLSTDPGVLTAARTDISGVFQHATALSLAPSATDLAGLRPGGKEPPPQPTTEAVRLPALMERMRQAVESQRPPEPRHLVFQLDPPRLGLVQVDMQWTPRGWNVNWSVTQGEMRDWLAQQLPTLQQQTTTQPILWNAPTLQTSSWDFSRQAHSRSHDEMEDGGFLADEETESDDGDSSRPNEYWA